MAPSIMTRSKGAILIELKAFNFSLPCRIRQVDSYGPSIDHSTARSRYGLAVTAQVAYVVDHPVST